MSTMEYVGKAWEIYKKNFWAIIIALILQMTIVSLPILIGIMPWIIIMFFSRISLTEATLTSLLLSNLGLLFFSIIMFIIGIVLSIVLNGGFVRVLHDALKGKAKFETMLKVAREKFWTLIGANAIVLFIFLLVIGVLLAPIAVLVAATSSQASFLYLFVIILTVIIGLIVLVTVNILLVFVNPAIVIDNLNAVDAVRKSFEVSKKNFMQVFLIFLIYFIINTGLENILFILGSIITAFVTTPMLLLSYIMFYVGKGKKRK